VALPQTLLGELAAPPRPHSWILGCPTSKERRGEKWERTKEEREG